MLELNALIEFVFISRMASMISALDTRTIFCNACDKTAIKSCPCEVSATTDFDSYAPLKSYIRTGSGTLTFT